MGRFEVVYVYIILTHFGTYYTGITNNLQRRWKEHNDGQSSYLRKFKPKQIIHVEVFNTRREAAKKERYIKSVGASKYLLRLQFRA